METTGNAYRWGKGWTWSEANRDEVWEKLDLGSHYPYYPYHHHPLTPAQNSSMALYNLQDEDLGPQLPGAGTDRLIQCHFQILSPLSSYSFNENVLQALFSVLEIQLWPKLTRVSLPSWSWHYSSQAHNIPGPCITQALANAVSSSIFQWPGGFSLIF